MCQYRTTWQGGRPNAHGPGTIPAFAVIAHVTHLYMPLARSFSIILCSAGKVNSAVNMVRMDRNMREKNSSPAQAA